jgi:hypothetical protein
MEAVSSGEKSRWDAMMEGLSKTDLTLRPSLGEAALPEDWETEPPVTEELDQAEAPVEEPDAEVPPVEQPTDHAVLPNPVMTSDELPQIITADMLRARRAQRKAIDFSDKDFEIPAELLAGYDEELDGEAEEEEDYTPGAGRGKEKTKGKKAISAAKPEKKSKKQKKRRPARPEDDLDDLY